VSSRIIGVSFLCSCRRCSRRWKVPSHRCANNVKQLALGCLHHESAMGYFPTGGWGWWWVGDPDRGFDANQPAAGLQHPSFRWRDRGPLISVPAAVPTVKAASRFAGWFKTPVSLDELPRPAATTTFTYTETDHCVHAGGVNPTPGHEGGTLGLCRQRGRRCPGRVPGRPHDRSGPPDRPLHLGEHDCTGIVYECSQITANQVTDGRAIRSCWRKVRRSPVVLYRQLGRENENMLHGHGQRQQPLRRSCLQCAISGACRTPSASAAPTSRRATSLLATARSTRWVTRSTPDFASALQQERRPRRRHSKFK